MSATGVLTPVPIAPRMFEQPVFSRHGTRFAIRTMETEQAAGIWIGDLARGALMRLTIPYAEPESPAWSPDGRRLAFVAGAPDGQAVFLKAADDGGEPQLVWRTPHPGHVGDWSPDGSRLAVMINDPQSLGDIWTVPLNGGPAEPWLNTQHSEREPRFSPDGRWIAYTSNESGRDEVYVRPFAESGGKAQVSVAGGDQPAFTSAGGR